MPAADSRNIGSAYLNRSSRNYELSSDKAYTLGAGGMLSSNKGGTSMNSRDQLVGGSWAIKAGSMTLGRHAIANQISQRAARLH